MEDVILENADIYTGEEEIRGGSIYISNGKIMEVSANRTITKENIRTIDCRGLGWVVPGMIDIHIHGASGHDVMDGTSEALLEMCKVLPSEGTTSFLATTMTSSESLIDRALVNAAHHIRSSNNSGAELLGFHLEGPFINKEKRGAQRAEHIKVPDVEKFQRWQELSGESIKLVTLAPEKDKDFTLIKYLNNKGITVSMGHTNGNYEMLTEATFQGVSHATHLFNGMSGLHHREPGAAGAALLSPDTSVEVIFDKIHVAPEMIKLAYNLKGSDKFILITDAMRAKNLVDGVYQLGGQEVFVRSGKALNEEGSLAGSTLHMHEARRNFANWIDHDVSVLTKITAVNPAKKIGVYHRKGSIHPGKDADIIVINDAGDVVLSMCRGELQATESLGKGMVQ
ncbi:N-acetylglucosamine-6-phosphate deacetylase [Thalassobacillus pellis]|uniref:N-acetylglucosamine-6-phosphate deacetylase n=1 Tax=Thalassobacillus pellis TaxID=748008 RepID=UPI001960CDFB|nr:N-acetylglucosamine-6-phosphate deacetylase [Thalassobacillus pellis]MBM7551572.1 N-acetylglucosamine-6-phosphate deacetylase [Thalassobacillus pellis]